MKIAFLTLASIFLFSQVLRAEDDPNRNIIKQGLLGAGVGAISASASGGKAGKGALIGAGTNVIGGALLNSLFDSGPKQPQGVQYAPPPADYGQQGPSGYYPVQSAPAPQGGYYQQQPAPQYYAPAPAPEDPNKKIIKQGLLGAGVGAISAGASGGKAGQGALIGAGTNIIGGALLDTLTAPSKPQQAQPPQGYYQQAPQGYYQYTPQQQTQTQSSGQTAPSPKRVIRKYDESGRLIYEEEIQN